MSKSSGEFLRLQLLIDKGYHPLAYRMMCLQAHYRSELEFSWEGLGAALTRLKRMVMWVERAKVDLAGGDHVGLEEPDCGWTYAALLARIEEFGNYKPPLINDAKPTDIACEFNEYLSSDLNTALGLTALEDVWSMKKLAPSARLALVSALDSVLGLNLLNITRADLRIRPKNAQITEEEIDAALIRRKQARAEKDFVTSDALRDELAAKGVEVMDGDPLGWEWKLG